MACVLPTVWYNHHNRMPIVGESGQTWPDLADEPFASTCRKIGQTPAAKKIRRPFAMPAAEGGGRWPGPIIERDGDRCYRGAPWFPGIAAVGWRKPAADHIFATPGTSSGTGV